VMQTRVDTATTSSSSGDFRHISPLPDKKYQISSTERCRTATDVCPAANSKWARPPPRTCRRTRTSDPSGATASRTGGNGFVWNPRSTLLRNVAGRLVDRGLTCSFGATPKSRWRRLTARRPRLATALPSSRRCCFRRRAEARATTSVPHLADSASALRICSRLRAARLLVDRTGSLRLDRRIGDKTAAWTARPTSATGRQARGCWSSTAGTSDRPATRSRLRTATRSRFDMPPTPCGTGQVRLGRR
jgi:hypothetical protein